jgi:hypothetical protein
LSIIQAALIGIGFIYLIATVLGAGSSTSGHIGAIAVLIAVLIILAVALTISVSIFLSLFDIDYFRFYKLSFHLNYPI